MVGLAGIEAKQETLCSDWLDRKTNRMNKRRQKGKVDSIGKRFCTVL